MRFKGKNLWGVSFDATAISGVVVEFLKTAKIFRDRGFEIHLDLGYDIKEDKDRFFRPYDDELRFLPNWLILDRVKDIQQIAAYRREFVTKVLVDVVQRGDDRLLQEIETAAAALSERIVDTWEELGVSVVIVENGTLPENITYTKALYRAIEAYGRRHTLGRFVLWRDHDLMWQSEPGTGKYGFFPYRYTPQPTNSHHIQYVVLHEDARRAMLDWAPNLERVSVLSNGFHFCPAVVGGRNVTFRRFFGIPDDALLIARLTRIIPQKRIDRDIDLLAKIRDVLRAGMSDRPPYLFIAGDIAESPTEYANLMTFAETLKVSDHVVFGGCLAPHDGDGTSLSESYSVRDLLAHSDLVSFLPADDYDSYGNPIGEAIASRVPYITSRYRFYDSVYGNRGFRAPVMEISTDDLPTNTFVREVAELLVDKERREEFAAFNYEIGKTQLSVESMKEVIDELFPSSAEPTIARGPLWPSR